MSSVGINKAALAIIAIVAISLVAGLAIINNKNSNGSSIQITGSGEGPQGTVLNLESMGEVVGDWNKVVREIIDYASKAYKGTVPYMGPPIVQLYIPEVTMTVATPEAASAEYTGNFQIRGVLESDLTAFNGTHILVSTPNGLSLYKVHLPGDMSLVWQIESSELVKRLAPNITVKLEINGKSYDTVLPVEAWISGVFLDKEGGIAIISLAYRGLDFSLLSTTGDASIFTPYKTLVVLFDKKMNVVGYHVIDGMVTDARMINDTLSVVTSLSSYVYYGVKPLAVIPMVDGGIIDADRVVVVSDEPAQYIIVTAISRTNASYNSIGLLVSPGGTLALLSKNGQLFVASNTWDSGVKLYSLKISPSEIVLTGTATLDGRIGSTWQLQPFNGYLIVLTEPTWSIRAVNLYVFNSSTLEKVSSITNLSVNEEVYGVRMVGGILYLVTYRTIDPLFAINISDPTSPVIIGYIKAPGVDFYLHPLPEGILGVGRDESGQVRVSIYKLVDNTLKPVSRVTIPFRDTPVFWGDGYKSLLYIEERGLLFFPVLVDRTSSGKYLYPTYVYAVVKVGDGNLTYIGVLQHYGALRAYAKGDVLYTVALENPYYVIMTPEVTKSPTSNYPVIVAWDLETLEPIGNISNANLSS
ncbi:MAG: beta-propeller domain-containing protein [Desulfurococcales archaeon]|nr:beta-propeller domain-containing protein [Desulfurococcales archaeon]